MSHLSPYFQLLAITNIISATLVGFILGAVQALLFLRHDSRLAQKWTLITGLGMLAGGVASIPVFLYIFPNSMPLVIIMVCSLIQVRYVKDKGSPLYLAVGWSFGAVGLIVSWLVSAWLFPSTINPVVQLNDFFGAIYTTILVTILFFGIGTSIVLARMSKADNKNLNTKYTK